MCVMLFSSTYGVHLLTFHLLWNVIRGTGKFVGDHTNLHTGVATSNISHHRVRRNIEFRMLYYNSEALAQSKVTLLFHIAFQCL
jgi:hypothetical protein